MRRTRIAAAALAAAALAAAIAPATQAHATTPTWTLSTISTGSDPLDHVDVYAPNDGLVHPALLFVHGGGWTVNYTDPSTLARFETIAQQQNWIVGFASYPTTAVGGDSVRGTEDGAVKADLIALRAFPHVDTTRVAMYGRSAGGQLAALIAYRNPTWVAAVVSSSGPVDMIATEKDADIAADVDYYESKTYAQTVKINNTRYVDTSPTYVSAPGCPPTFVMADVSDPLVPSAQFTAFRNVLNYYAVPNTVLIMPGTTHMPDDQVVPGSTETAQQEAIDYINQIEHN